MLLKALREEVLCANLALPKNGLVTFTWGNVSGIDHEQGLVVIKPSGVSYEAMQINDMVVVDMQGRVLEGNLRPSSDTPTHLALYRQYKEGYMHSEVGNRYFFSPTRLTRQAPPKLEYAARTRLSR